eukprot:TRINITY_DN872_c0_g1_i4.p1 TRINITY_DN872_c0_g1~~TRINITY_DN872_c0_g1_i4.p1  ORF type:complete len:626 (+),score=136.58 TRINITY_DN872_c0_g1_i4:65-1942(+)
MCIRDRYHTARDTENVCASSLESSPSLPVFGAPQHSAGVTITHLTTPQTSGDQVGFFSLNNNNNSTIIAENFSSEGLQKNNQGTTSISEEASAYGQKGGDSLLSSGKTSESNMDGAKAFSGGVIGEICGAATTSQSKEMRDERAGLGIQSEGTEGCAYFADGVSRLLSSNTFSSDSSCNHVSIPSKCKEHESSLHEEKEGAACKEGKEGEETGKGDQRVNNQRVEPVKSSGKMSEIKKKKTQKKNAQKVQGLTKGFLEENEKCSAFLLEEAQSLAKRFGGQCLSTTCESDNSILSFKCEMGHTRQATLSEARNDWCPLCRKTLNQLQEYVRTKFGGRILNHRLAKTLLVRCRNNHEWTCEVKYLNKRECTACKKMKKEEIKKAYEEETKKRLKEDEELQKKLFDEARRKFLSEGGYLHFSQGHSQQQQFNGNHGGINFGFSNNVRRNTPHTAEGAAGSGHSNVQNVFKAAMISRYQLIERDMEKLAKKFTLDFMSNKAYDGSVSYQQIFEVYKFLLIPEDVMKNYFLHLEVEEVKSEYRKLAKALHPDKNKHPEAGIAFQKIHGLYAMALQLANTHQFGPSKDLIQTVEQDFGPHSIISILALQIIIELLIYIVFNLRKSVLTNC